MKSSLKRQAIIENVPTKYIYSELKKWKGNMDIYKCIKKLLDNNNRFNYVFIGNYNEGKTYLAAAMIKNLLSKKKVAIFKDFKEIMDSFERDRYKITNPLLSEIFGYDFMVIDGVDLEIWNAFNEWTKITFAQLLRIALMKTNISLLLTIDTSMDYSKKKDIIDDFGEHLGRILITNFTPLYFKGE